MTAARQPCPDCLAIPTRFRLHSSRIASYSRTRKTTSCGRVWLDGHGHVPPGAGSFFVHGYLTGRYEGEQLVVETTRFTFDPAEIAGDFMSAPSSTHKRLVERYTRVGDNLRMDHTKESDIYFGPSAASALHRRGYATDTFTFGETVTALRR